MELTPQIYSAKVMHKRLFPKENAFSYAVYYLALPLPAVKLPGKLLSFHHKDIGKRDGSDPTVWAKQILADYRFTPLIKDIMLITMPRVLGYIFNPVSFYLCLDADSQLRAVICEVHNTFGEQHIYFCANSDQTVLSADTWLAAEKVFHVSPFLPRDGHYRFRFDLQAKTLGIWIDYYDAQGNKQLITSLLGKFTPLNAASLRRAFWSHPLVTLKTITLIHWQAFKLIRKRILYFNKPTQNDQKITATSNLTKM